MRSRKWNPAGALARVPIFYKVVVANSVMAGVVIATLLLLRDETIAVLTLLVGAGVINALLVRAAFSVDHIRDQQREVLAWTIATSERERGRVAAEIHDGAAQRLAALVVRSSGNQLVSTEAAAVMRDLCDSASRLQPPGMALLGLQGALGWYARERQRAGMQLEISADCPPDAVDPDIALGAYRLIEDMIGMAADAGAERAELFVLTSDTHLVISARLPHTFTAAERFRLAERVALLDGVFDFARDAGDSVMRITIPERSPHV